MTKRMVRCLEPDLPASAPWVLVGQRLRARRTELGYEVNRVADELGVSPRVYDSYERGSARAPALLLAQIADLFGIPVLWFFQDVSAREEKDERAGPGPARSYRVATADERVGYLADSFRKLDLEGQQHLLVIADALCRSNRRRG